MKMKGEEIEQVVKRQTVQSMRWANVLSQTIKGHSHVESRGEKNKPKLKTTNKCMKGRMKKSINEYIARMNH